MDKLGFGVFATCLTKKGEESLKAVTSSRVFPLHLDVTDSQKIKAVYARMKELLPPDCGGLARGHAISFPPLPPPSAQATLVRGFSVGIIANII